MKRLFIAFAFLAIPSLSFAQSQSTLGTDIYVGVNTGTLSPTEENVLDGAGFSFGGSLTAVTAKYFGFGVSYLGAINGDTTLGGSTSFQSGSADAKFMVPLRRSDGGNVTPYLRTGVGLYQFKAEIDGVTQETGINAQVPLGAGFLVDLNERFALGGDFAYHFLADSNFDNNRSSANLVDAWESSIGLSIKL